MTEHTEKNYIHHVTSLGDSHNVETHEEIYSESGVKLVNEGVKIDRSFYDRLIKHKLLKPIDHSLMIENVVTSDVLIKEAKKLINDVPSLNIVIMAMNDQELPLRILSLVDLAPPLAFKLTVARERSPEMFQHSITVALIAICLADKEGHDRQALIDIATAGIYHDLGILHINPELLDPSTKVTDADRHSLYAHPMVAYLILKEFPQYHPVISHAVLDHHERIDGSGYPRGLQGDEISEFGKILAVAELFASFIDGEPEIQMLEQLQIILKFNTSKYSPRYTRHVISLYKPAASTTDTSSTVDATVLSTTMKGVAEILSQWDALSDQQEQNAQDNNFADITSLIEERVQELKHSFARVGMLPEDFSTIVAQIHEDPESMKELSVLVDEMGFQVKMLFSEIDRHLEETNVEHTDAYFSNWVEASKQKIITM